MRVFSIIVLLALTHPAFAAEPASIKEDDAPVQRASTQTEHGMELFSWQVKGNDTWHFALLRAPGIEKLKTAGIVASKENALDGVDALKKKLAALALNEKVGWFNMLDKKDTPPEELQFDFPPKEMVRDLELYCTVLKVRLNIYRACKRRSSQEPCAEVAIRKPLSAHGGTSTGRFFRRDRHQRYNFEQLFGWPFLF